METRTSCGACLHVGRKANCDLYAGLIGFDLNATLAFGNFFQNIRHRRAGGVFADFEIIGGGSIRRTAIANVFSNVWEAGAWLVLRMFLAPIAHSTTERLTLDLDGR